MTALDFLIIGAQKCATTTLFELLRQHRELQLPLEKEVPFFTETSADGSDAAAWARFARRYFAADGRRIGKVTPQYMADARVPRRLAALMPDCRLIAVLRDPLERSYSHFRMAQRRGTETRDFAAAMAPLLDPCQQQRARSGSPPRHAQGYEPEADYYLAWSEYGRILTDYRRCFGAQQLLVIYSEELQDNPRQVLQRVLRFIGVSTDFHPRGLGEVMHAGGGGNRLPPALRVWLRELGPVAALWRRVPPQLQGRLRFLYERWNARSTGQRPELPADLEAALRHHLRADLDRLLDLGCPGPPWQERYPEPVLRPRAAAPSAGA